MTTPERRPAAEIYATMSDTVLFDVMAEVATQLKGELVYHFDRAETEERREQLRARMREVRDERWSVRAGDRAAQLARIEQWDAERRRLQAGEE